jgi:hypothetical protein
MRSSARSRFFVLSVALAAWPLAVFGNECATPSGSVRVMRHEADVLAGRLSLYAKAPNKPDARAQAIHKLFEAAACPQLTQGEGSDRNVECTVPGAATDAIVVGVSQKYDSVGSAALLASLQEALAAAPRRHTFRWIAFSAHETKEERTKVVQKPKGATRVVDALDEAERALVRAMVHIGPVGFGPVWTHPANADDRLKCTLETAAKIAGVDLGAADNLVRDCDPAPGRLECEEAADWSGGNDWRPFRRTGIPVFGIHTGSERKLGGRIDGNRYVATYRMLAVFLALADEALAAPSAVQTGDAVGRAR